MALVASPRRVYSSFMRGYTPCRDLTSNSVWKCDTMALRVWRVGLRSTCRGRHRTPAMASVLK